MPDGPPIHAQRLEDGSQGAYRLYVALWRGAGNNPRRVELGLGTNDKRLATERACYMLKGMMAAGIYSPRIYSRDAQPRAITREMVEQWLADTGHVVRSVSYSARKRREMLKRGLDGYTEYGEAGDPTN